MLKISIQDRKGSSDLDHDEGPLLLGRHPEGDVAKYIISDPRVSRSHLLIEELDGGRLQLENLSGKNPVVLSDGTRLEARAECEVDLPTLLTLGTSQIKIACPGAPVEADAAAANAISEETLETDPKLIQKLGDSPDAQTLANWFETLVRVQQAAAGSEEFLSQTARAVVELIGLDRGLVLLRKDGGWEVAAFKGRDQIHGRMYSHSILERILNERKTLFENFGGASMTESLVDVESVVAAPVFDESNAVIGAVYGSRSAGLTDTKCSIRPLEAQLVQVMASAVGAGLARLEQQHEAIRAQVQFEQFFSAALARELGRDQTLLDGRQREVTVLFSDVRNFAGISESVGPGDVFRLMQDVMELQSSRIHDNGGVVVDYYGDGLLAMWNAPAEQEDHAARACKTALTICRELSEISAKWQDKVGAPLRLGFGINTGSALVGNTGSMVKMKYGPMGPTVNLASRVEGTVKQLGVSIIITGSTREKLDDLFATRRLCKARLVGIAEPIDLFELCDEESTPAWIQFRDNYEQALSEFESRKWEAACHTIYRVLDDKQWQFDMPSLNLLSESVDCLRNHPKTFDPVVNFKK